MWAVPNAATRFCAGMCQGDGVPDRSVFSLVMFILISSVVKINTKQLDVFFSFLLRYAFSDHRKSIPAMDKEERIQMPFHGRKDFVEKSN